MIVGSNLVIFLVPIGVANIVSSFLITTSRGDTDFLWLDLL